MNTLEENLAWVDAAFPSLPDDIGPVDDDEGLGDHLIGDDDVFVAAEPPMRLEFAVRLVDGAPAVRDIDGEFSANLYSAAGDYFGGLISYDTDGGHNAHLATIKTDPSDSRLRCFHWLRNVREFAMDGVVASFGDELGFHGDPVVLPIAGESGAILVWKCHPGGVIVHLGDTTTGCGQCMGCKSIVEVQERAPTSWVYFIQSTQGGPVKIGYSANPVGRLSTLQTAHAHPLKIIGRMVGGLAVERSLHTLFAADRVRPDGEWFRPSAALLAFIREVGGAG